MRQERCVCGRENAQQFVRRTIHRLWHMLSECESRIGEMQERARIEKKCKKNSRKTPRWCCRLGVFDVHWCSANVFVFRRTHSAHRKHKMYLPTMALNWLKVVHNYNYITREWISEQTRSSERAREKRKNQHVSISERFIHQASNSCAHRNRVMRWFRTGVPLTIRELTHHFFFSFNSMFGERKTAKRSIKTIFSYTVTLFAFRTVRNSECISVVLCSMLCETTTVTVHHQKHREIYLCSFFLHIFLCVHIHQSKSKRESTMPHVV